MEDVELDELLAALRDRRGTFRDVDQPTIGTWLVIDPAGGLLVAVIGADPRATSAAAVITGQQNAAIVFPAAPLGCGLPYTLSVARLRWRKIIENTSSNTKITIDKAAP